LKSPLKEKVLAVLDTAYAGEEGIRALVEESEDILQKQRLVEEKRLVQRFLGELARDTGLATYGEKQVRKSLERGAVEIILLSEGIDYSRVTVQCGSCGDTTEKTLTPDAMQKLEEELDSQQCQKCQNQSLQITKTQDIIEELSEVANETGAEIEIVSPETEEGKQLLSAFRGIGAILRWADQG
jgi:peptide chain release factor subunit 1